MWMCRAGCPWSMLPCPHNVSYKTVYHRFNIWSRMRIFEHAFYNLAIQYRQHNQNPLIIDSTQVKNVYGVDVVGRNHADRGRNSTKVSLLTDFWGLFPLPCHSSEEIATIAKPYDIRWMKPAEKLMGPYRHMEVYMPIRAMIVSRVEVFVEITAWMQLYHKEGVFRCETV